VSRRPLAVAPARPARAADRFDGASVALDVQAGVNSPLGVYGVALDVSLARHFAAWAGAGLTSTPVAALGARFRQPLGRAWALGLGLSFAVESYGQTNQYANLGNGMEILSRSWAPAYRVGVELSAAYRSAGGFGLRPFVAAGWILNGPSSCEYTSAFRSYQGPCQAPGVPDHLDLGYRPLFLGAGVAVGHALLDPPGHATPGGGEQAEVTWYGWQSLALDALNVGVAVAEHPHNNGHWYAHGGELQAAGYLAGGPAIHFGHGNPGRAAVSFALRAFLLLVGGLLGATGSKSDPNDGGTCLPCRGMIGGAVAAMVVDDLVVSLPLEAFTRPPDAPRDVSPSAP
jgi:hypothetical protein